MSTRKAKVTREHLEDVIATWAQRLDLLQWEFTLKLDTPPEHTEGLAEIHCHEQYDRAAIFLRPDWQDWPQRGPIGDLGISLDYLICHELLHAQMRDLDKIPLDDIEGMIHRDAHAVVIEAYVRKREHLVDHLARALENGWGPA